MWLLINFVLGGIITTQDLADYTAKIKTPLNITVRRKNENFILFSPPPPFSGAIDLFILNVLKGRHVFMVTEASCCVGLYPDISPLDYNYTAWYVHKAYYGLRVTNITNMHQCSNPLICSLQYYFKRIDMYLAI